MVIHSTVITAKIKRLVGKELLLHTIMGSNLTPERYVLWCRDVEADLRARVNEITTVETEVQGRETGDIFERLLSLLYLRRECLSVSVVILKGKRYVASKFYRSTSTSNFVLPNCPGGSRKVTLYETLRRKAKKLKLYDVDNEAWIATSTEFLSLLDDYRTRLEDLAFACGRSFRKVAEHLELGFREYELETLKTVARTWHERGTRSVSMARLGKERRATSPVQDAGRFVEVAQQSGLLLLRET